MATTKRIELSDGNWAELRTRLTVADLRYQRERTHARGYDDETLDGLSLIPRMVSSWSYGDVTDEVMDTIPVEDATEILKAATPSGEASSTGSSAGGSSRKASRPSNG